MLNWITGLVDAPGITPAPVKGTLGWVSIKFRVSVEFEGVVVVDPLVDEPVVAWVVEVELSAPRVSVPLQSLLTL
jgi:hypothetical protein